ncbi:branched-chain amino acid ABC transporter permease [Clostridiaceae bacterium]|nr:branched-chain amino acid ABC transporter permease [Clostridiaceae bacterium]RKI13600.1 branched-chain amino acid ABC transporter permease [bacterium 1XD21-70]
MEEWKEEPQQSALPGRTWFLRGMKAGLPIGMGYFAVAFTLGIAARKAGLSSVQAGFMSATMLASAGQFAGFGALASGAGYLEMVVTEIVVNLRYLLMSGALSQKVMRDKPFFHRLLMAYGVTDEIFAVSMGVPGRLHPCYMYGAAATAAPGWVMGTVLGALLGMVLPARAMSAMGVALYGMFLAIVIPPAKKSRIIAGVVVGSMAVSALFAGMPGLKQISSGFQVIILTILISGAAAVLFPVQEGKEETEDEA